MAKTRKPPAARRAGYVAAVVFFLVGYWAVGMLSEWSWVPFITSEFGDVVPAIRVGIIVGLAVNLAYLVSDPRWLLALGEAVTSAVNAVIGVIVLRAFPFEFTPHAWETVARIIMIIGIVGAAIGVVVNLVKFVIALFSSDDETAAASS